MAGTSRKSSAADAPEFSVKGDEGKKKQKAEKKWLNTEILPDLMLSIAADRVIRRQTTSLQEIIILETKPFGRVLVVNGKPQCAEVDGFVYYETLVHPALLMHDNPRKVLIMGGGDGSAAREVLKYKTVEHVVLCEIDKEVVYICKLCFRENWGAFADQRLTIETKDAREILKDTTMKFDVIIGDLPAPTEGGRGSYRDLYTKTFYQSILKQRLNEDGIFITHAGMAGVGSHRAFSSIFNALRQVFLLYADTCGWVMASDMPLVVSHGEIDKRIAERIKGKLRYHDGGSILASTIVNKIISESLTDYTSDHLVDDGDAT